MRSLAPADDGLRHLVGGEEHSVPRRAHGTLVATVLPTGSGVSALMGRTLVPERFELADEAFGDPVGGSEVVATEVAVQLAGG